ncbi:MAG: hypothetical protein J1F01_05515 [Oscillospiraceae bacterium]|nr:hypothetical protein [Oscillospiraceae bacterium]
MFERIGQLYKYIKSMNREGFDMLVDAACDIVSNKNYRKPDAELTPEQFNRSVRCVLNMVEKNYCTSRHESRDCCEA